MPSKLSEDEKAQRALEQFKEHILISVGNSGSYTARGPAHRNTLINSLLATDEWEIYRDAPRIDELPVEKIRESFLRKVFNREFKSTVSGEAIVEYPTIYPPLAVLKYLGKEEDIDCVLGALRKGSEYTLIFTPEEMQRINDYIEKDYKKVVNPTVYFGR